MQVRVLPGVPECDTCLGSGVTVGETTFHRPVAQSGPEQAALNRRVAGSNPAGLTKWRHLPIGEAGV